ncbi:MAG: hypothetical protein HQ593_01885 [Candidatus Omnitrophica bacterium]|nr:hypothetical protein [Candidatus Omnitrophota bacterium]
MIVKRRIRAFLLILATALLLPLLCPTTLTAQEPLVYADKEKEALSKELSTMKLKFEALKEAAVRQVDKALAEKDETLKEVVRLKDEVYQLEILVDTLNDARDDLKNSLADSEKDRRDLRTSVDPLEKKIKLLEQENETGRKYNKNLKKSLDTARRDLEKMNKENIKLYDGRSDVSNKNMELEEKIAELKKELRDRKSKKSSHSYKIKELEDEVEKLNKSLIIAAQENKLLKEGDGTYQQKLEFFKKSLAAANAKVLSYSNRLKEARVRTEEMRLKIMELSDAQSELSQMKAIAESSISEGSEQDTASSMQPDQQAATLEVPPVETVAQVKETLLDKRDLRRMGEIDEIVYLENKPTLYVKLSPGNGEISQDEQLYVIENNTVLAELRVISHYPALGSLVCEVISRNESVVLKKGAIVVAASQGE